MKYLGDSFTVAPGGTKEYRDGWERIFGKGKSKDNSIEIEKPELVKKIDITRPAEEAMPKKKKRGRKNEKNKKQKK